MNARLQNLFEQAEAQLAPGDQSRLAALVESFVTTHQGALDFTEAERNHLRQVADEPFEAADPADLAAIFDRRG